MSSPPSTPQVLVGMTAQAADDLLAAHGVRVSDYDSTINMQVLRDAIGCNGVNGPVRVPYHLASVTVSHGKVRDVRVFDKVAEAMPCLLVACDSSIHDATSFEMWDLAPEHGYIDRLEFEC